MSKALIPHLRLVTSLDFQHWVHNLLEIFPTIWLNTGLMIVQYCQKANTVVSATGGDSSSAT